jgi:hypothetical protein
LSLDWQDLRAAVDGGADVAVLKGLDAIAVGDRLHLAYFVDIPTGYDDVDPHGKFRFVGGVEPAHEAAERSSATGHTVIRRFGGPVDAEGQAVGPSPGKDVEGTGLVQP